MPNASVSHMQVADVNTEGTDPFPPIAKPAFMEVSVRQEVRCSNQGIVMGAAGSDRVSSPKCFDLAKKGHICLIPIVLAPYPGAGTPDVTVSLYMGYDGTHTHNNRCLDVRSGWASNVRETTQGL